MRRFRHASEGRRRLNAILRQWTATAIARDCGVTPAAISALSTGVTREPKASLAAALECMGILADTWKAEPAQGTPQELTQQPSNLAIIADSLLLADEYRMATSPGAQRVFAAIVEILRGNPAAAAAVAERFEKDYALSSPWPYREGSVFARELVQRIRAMLVNVRPFN